MLLNNSYVTFKSYSSSKMPTLGQKFDLGKNDGFQMTKTKWGTSISLATCQGYQSRSRSNPKVKF